MAIVGTLEWAEEEIRGIEVQMAKYEEKADEMFTTVYAEAGRENLSELEDRLEDIIDLLDRHDDADSLREKAFELYYSVHNTKTLL